MLTEYTPTHEDLKTALAALRYPLPNAQEEDYAQMLGRLRAVIELAAADKLYSQLGYDAYARAINTQAAAFRQVFFDPQRGDTQNGAWATYMLALSEIAEQLRLLHEIQPPPNHDHLDHLLEDIAKDSANMLSALAIVRQEIHAAVNGDPDEDPMPLAELVRDSAMITAMLSSALIPHDNCEHDHEDDEEDEEDGLLPEDAAILRDTRYIHTHGDLAAKQTLAKTVRLYVANNKKFEGDDEKITQLKTAHKETISQLRATVEVKPEIPGVEQFVLDLLEELTEKGWLHGWEDQPDNGGGCIAVRITDPTQDSGYMWFTEDYSEIANTVQSMVAGIRMANGLPAYGPEKLPARPAAKKD